MNSRRSRGPRLFFPQSLISFLPFDLAELLEEVRLLRVPEAPRGIAVAFAEQRPLAAICGKPGAWEWITVHPILNRPDTPREVLAFLLQHELLHTVIPSSMLDGHRESHPPEFFEAEVRRSPPGERADVLYWLATHFEKYLLRGPRGTLTIRAKWQGTLSDPFCTLDETRRLKVALEAFQKTMCWEDPRPEALDAWVEAA